MSEDERFNDETRSAIRDAARELILELDEHTETAATGPHLAAPI